MDFINKAIAQLSELFRSMTPAARITTALLLVVIVVSVAYLFNHQFSGGDAYLFSGEMVSPSQLPAMSAAFGKAGLVEAEIDGNRIRVPRGKQAVYMAALAEAGALPHNFLDPLKKALEGNFFTDRKVRDEKVKVAVQEQLAEIVGHMTGIESATVMYNVEGSSGFGAKKIVTASVTVKPTGEQSLTDDQVQKIRLAVGPPIGTPPETVAVVDINGHPHPGSAPGESGDMGSDKYLNTKLKYEQDFGDRIRQAISTFVSGAVVSVDVELHPELEDVQSKTQFDPKAVPFKQQETSKTQSTTSSPPAGRPGLGSQLANSPAVVGGGSGGNKSEDEQSMSTIENRVSNEIHQVKKAGLTPKRVTASVAVPSDYFEEVWRLRNPTAAGATPKKPDAAALATIEDEVTKNIKSHVVGILPAAEEGGKDPVTVTTFPHIPTPAVEKPSTVDHAMFWFTEHASSIGMGFLGLFSLLMVRSIVRSVPAAASVPAAPESREISTAATADIEEEAPAPADAAPRLRRRRSKSGPSLRDELVEIVRDDPDAAANILRNWIGSAN